MTSYSYIRIYKYIRIKVNCKQSWETLLREDVEESIVKVLGINRMPSSLLLIASHAFQAARACVRIISKKLESASLYLCYIDNLGES